MALPSATLETRYTANIQQMERELQRLQRLNDRAANNIAAANKRAAQQSQSAWERANISKTLERQIAGVGASIRGLAPMLAGLFAGREALAAADTYTRFTNSLKVAGLEGSRLSTVQEALYQSAIKNGVALEPLGKLYGRASQSATELGASQEQLLQFTNGITSALRVAGTSTEEASGALLQLSQALAAGKIQAEEFNSINEGARPILEAVARGNDKYGGSVAKLRAAMLDGKLSSKDFFAAFLAGSASLEAQAAKAPLTVAASFQNLQTALTRYIGEADQSLGISDKLTFAIKLMSENMDVLAESVMVLGLAYSATFLPSLGRAGAALALGTAATVRSTVATIADTVALISRTAAIHGVSVASAGAAVATRALGTALAFFGGPIGIAITAIGAAIAYLGVSSAKAAFDTAKLHDEIETKRQALESAEKAAAKQRVETGNLSSAQKVAARDTAALTGEVHRLKDAHYEAAAAAKAHALAEARQEASRTLGVRNRARAAFDQRVAQEERRMGQAGLDPRVPRAPLTPRQRNEARRRAFATPEGQDWANSVRNAYADAQTVKTIRETKLDEYKPAPVPDPTDKPKGGKGSGSTKSDNTDASRSAVQQAENAYEQALTAAAHTFEERHARALENLARDRDEQNEDLARRAAKGEITKAAAEEAKALVEKTYQQNLENEAFEYRNNVADRQNEITSQLTEARAEELRQEAAILDGMGEVETDLRKRFGYERQALAKRQQADDETFRVEQDILALNRLKEGYTQEEVDQLRSRAQANRDAQKRNETGQLERDQKRDTPKNVAGQIDDYAKSFGSLNDQLSNIAKNGIDSITNGLTDAVMGAKSFREAFGEMAKQVIAQLIRMAIQFAVFEAIGAAFGMPGLGVKSLGVKSGSNAAGTNYWKGGFTTLNENGDEAVFLPNGTKIVPNNVLNRAFETPKSGARGAPNVSNYITVNANDAVLTGWVKQQVQQGVAEGFKASATAIPRSMNEEQRNSFMNR